MNIFQKIWNKAIILLAKIQWKPANFLTEPELDKIEELLTPDYYIILTRNNNHFSTYMISLGNFFLTGKFSYWGHVLMNLENKVTTRDDFMLIEAIGKGVTISKFNDVFSVNSVALLRAKNLTADKWTAILDAARSKVGRPYDNLFDLKSDAAINCVELVRDALLADPDYATNFAQFEAMINEHKILTPQMFHECEDFEVVYEIRHH